MFLTDFLCIIKNVENLTDEEIRNNKKCIEEYLRSTNREGIEDILSFLSKSGYYYLYGSFKHHAYKGGLAQHSLEVLRYALDNNKNCPQDSVIIASLLHDLCKTKYNFPDGVEYIGHGTKSVSIIDDFIKFKLTYDEWNAIRFHMGSKAFIRDEAEEKRFIDAKDSELWQLIHIGDCISAGNYPRTTHGIVGGIMKTFGL